MIGRIFDRTIAFLYVIVFLFLLSTSPATVFSKPPLNHGNALHNATDKFDVTAWGVRGIITWTNPPLNGGFWSYTRVALLVQSPFKFVEWGWYKTCEVNCFVGLIAWDDGSGLQNLTVPGIIAGDHTWSIQYDPNTSRYYFYVDAVSMYNLQINMSSGNRVTAGGEVNTGIERMNHVRTSSLNYLFRRSDGTFTFRPWTSHTNYVDDPPFYNTNINSAGFYSDP